MLTTSDLLTLLATSGSIPYVRRCNSWMGSPATDGWVYTREDGFSKCEGRVELTAEMLSFMREHQIMLNAARQ